MQGWQIRQYGHFQDVLHWETMPTPQTTPNQVIVDVWTAGVNFADILAIAGKYQVKSPLPFVPGMEVVGHVVAKGSNVNLAIGTRVLGFTYAGGFAQQLALPEHTCLPIPDFVTNETAAAMLITYQTAWLALTERGQLKPGEHVLIHAGSSGVGSAAIQIAKHLGAIVMATASTPEKLNLCKSLGADFVIDYQKENFVDIIRHETHGKGVDVIYDPVGGQINDLSLKCIAWNGRLVIIGFASGQIPQIAANRIMLKNIAVTGINWPAYFDHQPALIAQAQQRLWQALATHAINPYIDVMLPLKQLPEALARLETRQSHGKVILQVT